MHFAEGELQGPYADGTSSVLSVKGKKVLHIDRNDHYGGYAQTIGVGWGDAS